MHKMLSHCVNFSSHIMFRFLLFFPQISWVLSQVHVVIYFFVTCVMYLYLSSCPKVMLPYILCWNVSDVVNFLPVLLILKHLAHSVLRPCGTASCRETSEYCALRPINAV